MACYHIYMRTQVSGTLALAALRWAIRGTMQDARGTSAKHGMADAITRANLYSEAGADASLVQGPRGTYELQAIAKNTKGLRAVSISEGGLTPLHTYQQLKEMGFQLVRSGSTLVTVVDPALVR